MSKKKNVSSPIDKSTELESNGANHHHSTYGQNELHPSVRYSDSEIHNPVFPTEQDILIHINNGGRSVQRSVGWMDQDLGQQLFEDSPIGSYAGSVKPLCCDLF